MKVMRFNDAVQTPALIEGIAPQPQPGPGELSIRVYAAGVTPSEILWYPTSHLADGLTRHGAIPGHEFSGVIESLGPGVSDFTVGQEVYGMNDWFADGATAEFCLSKPEWIAPKPATLTHQEAATIPISALTAYQGLFDRAALQSGERVLVQGGSGSVGAFAIQLAINRGAEVVATASSRNLNFVTALGAARVVDYQKERFEEVVEPVDVVFDTVGGTTFWNSLKVLKPGGRIFTIAAQSEGAKDDRLQKAFFIVEPSQKQLSEIAGLLENRKLKAFSAEIIPFTRASEAYEGRKTDGRGKSAIVVAE